MVKLLRRFLKMIFPSSLLFQYFNRYYLLHGIDIRAVNNATQILLSLKYKELLRSKSSLPSFDEVGFRVFSQCEEDGILLYIFSLIGTINKKGVDIGAGWGINSNITNLIVNHGWTALLIDADPAYVKFGQHFYSHSEDTKWYPPKFICAQVGKENINALISEHGYHGEIDLLSIDIDGMDWWIWNALECCTPRVVIVEFNEIWEPDKSLTIPYNRNFRVSDIHPEYYGASLTAFVNLGREKGYRLVGCNRYGYNAFFVRSGLGDDILPEVSPDSCLKHPRVMHKRENYLIEVRDHEWVEV